MIAAEMLDFILKLNYISRHLGHQLFTKYMLSAEGVESLKNTVQSPLEFGWDVKEQRPGRERCHPVQILDK